MADITAKIGMPLDEYIQLSNDQPFEIINGERIPRMPTVAGHNTVTDTLYVAVKSHTQANNLGIARMEATFVLPDAYDSNWVEGARIPDVLFITAARWEEYLRENPDWREKPYLIVPDFVAEVVSPNDSYSKVDEKVDIYLLDGVRLIWVLDPQRRKTTVHAPDLERPLILKKEDDILDGGDVIPGFKITLSNLFE
jgi:Uma2 family endonuclease